MLFLKGGHDGKGGQSGQNNWDDLDDQRGQGKVVWNSKVAVTQTQWVIYQRKV